MVLTEIKEIEKCIFDCKIKEAMEKVPNLIEKLFELRVLLKNEEIEKFNEILEMANTSIENKDYLLFVDILKYEIEALFLNLENSEYVKGLN